MKTELYGFNAMMYADPRWGWRVIKPNHFSDGVLETLTVGNKKHCMRYFGMATARRPERKYVTLPNNEECVRVLKEL